MNKQPATRADRLQHVMTKPLDQTELATWFGVSVKRIKPILASREAAS